MRTRLVLSIVLGLGGQALAQGPDFEGLDLSTPTKKPAKGLVEVPAPPLPPPPDDFAEGPPVAALPPVRQGGRIDQDAYRTLHAALKERLDARLVSSELTVKAVETEKLGQKLGTIAARERLAEVLKAQVLVVLDAPAGKVEARLLASPAAPTSAEASLPIARGKKLTQEVARQLVDELLKKGESTLRPTPAVDLTAPSTPVAEGSDDSENVAAQAVIDRSRPVRRLSRRLGSSSSSALARAFAPSPRRA